MTKGWEKFRGDFNALTDEEIEEEVAQEQEKLAEAEEWLEAVVAWKKAGKPRDV